MRNDGLPVHGPAPKFRAVDKDIVSEAIAKWLPALRLPPAPAPGVKDLRGEAIRVAKFTEEELVRFFFPRRNLAFQQTLQRRLAEHLRKRGAKIESVRAHDRGLRPLAGRLGPGRHAGAALPLRHRAAGIEYSQQEYSRADLE
jgi:hypothetical protein